MSKESPQKPEDMHGCTMLMSVEQFKYTVQEGNSCTLHVRHIAKGTAAVKAFTVVTINLNPFSMQQGTQLTFLREGVGRLDTTAPSTAGTFRLKAL